MNHTAYIAKHLRDVHTGGNWTVSNLKTLMSDVTWKQATTKVYDFNTIATLVYHIHYFVGVASEVLDGKPLSGNDKLSFNHPPIANQLDWDHFLEKVFAAAEKFASLIEKLPEEKLWEPFTNEKYGSYYRNLNGIIEHTHYHLGQIALIKKIVIHQSKK